MRCEKIHGSPEKLNRHDPSLTYRPCRKAEGAVWTGRFRPIPRAWRSCGTASRGPVRLQVSMTQDRSVVNRERWKRRQAVPALTPGRGAMRGLITRGSPQRRGRSIPRPSGTSSGCRPRPTVAPVPVATSPRTGCRFATWPSSHALRGLRSGLRCALASLAIGRYPESRPDACAA